MIITRLVGGLGNQMFQYAAGRALALHLGVELKLDLSWFDSFAQSGYTPRSFMLDAFPGLCAAIATRRECDLIAYARRGLLDFLLRRPLRHAVSYVSEPYFSYWDGFGLLNAPAYLFGYWQNELYFSAVSDMIRCDFVFPPLPAGGAEEMARRIQAAHHAVAVHVRRGDYVSNQVVCQFHGVCPPEYYSRALETMAVFAEPELFLFSDEPDWVRDNFDTRCFPATVIDFPEHADTPWHDMHLMSLCKCHIIANSSFSWWGAWLANNGGLVCAPRRWFAEKGKTDDNPAPDRWILL